MRLGPNPGSDRPEIQNRLPKCKTGPWFSFSARSDFFPTGNAPPCTFWAAQTPHLHIWWPTRAPVRSRYRGARVVFGRVQIGPCCSQIPVLACP
jgi:hypothetical protein